MKKRLRTVLALLICGVSVGFTQPVLAADWTYTLRPGDDLWTIARLHCGSSAYAQRIADHNAFADPTRLRAGQRVRIPVAWLVRQPSSVVVAAVGGRVTDGKGQRISVGQELSMGERLITAAAGFALVRFADGTELEVGPDADVLFNVLTAFGDSGMVDSSLRLYRGGGTARVRKRADGSQFRVWTPTGIAAVRGTEFRLGVAESAPGAAASASSRVETLTGAVGFEQAQQTASVPAGTGLVASAAGVVTETLLPAPVFADADIRRRSTSDELRWTAAPAAAGHQLDLYDRDASPAVLVKTIRLDAPRYDLAEFEPGRYRVAVRSVAASDLRGYDAVLDLELVRAVPVPQTQGIVRAAERLEWAGDASTYEVEIRAADDAARQPRRFERSTQTLPLNGTLMPGAYRWRVREAGGDFSTALPLLIPPASPQAVRVTAGSWANGRSIEVSWGAQSGVDYDIRLVDDAGNSAADARVRASSTTATWVSPVLVAGSYQVEVVPRLDTVDGPITGGASRSEVNVLRRVPWWQPAALLLPLLLL
ncbi:MAG: FecR domain-containing protein [Pseudomonadota bacterium]